jgi:RHS repeat-associated protein
VTLSAWGSGSGTATYDEQDRLVSLPTATPTTFEYEPDGRLKTKKVGTAPSVAETTYSYDVLGRLTSVDAPGTADDVTYTVDPLGRRTGRVGPKVASPGTGESRWRYLDQLRIGAELDSSGEVTTRYVYGGKANVPEFMVRYTSTTTTVYRLITDERGSLRLVVKVSDGSVVQRTDYDVWGNITGDYLGGWPSGEEPPPFGFAGGLHDRTTGLVRFGARDYDPSVGRWTGKDPIRFRGRDTNLYAYAGSEPVNYIDPTGLRVGVGYASREEAARQALADYMAYSNLVGEEIGGRIYESGGRYFHTPGVWGNTLPSGFSGVRQEVDPSFANGFCGGRKIVGEWHTHTDRVEGAERGFSPQDKRGLEQYGPGYYAAMGDSRGYIYHFYSLPQTYTQDFWSALYGDPPTWMIEPFTESFILAHP